MNRVLALADRLSLPALTLLAALNVLFFLSFLFVALLASGQARAEVPVCAGGDLVAELRSDNPAALADIERQAAATENGDSLLWKIEKGAAAPSFLFGTMHVTDPRVTSLPPEAAQAFDEAGTLVIETTDVLEQSSMMEIMAKRPDLMMFTDATTLASLLSPEDRTLVEAALSARGIPLGSVTKMKPWVLAALVSLPACELARKAAGEPVLDLKLAQDAKAAGKPVTGLETAVSQMEAMNALPMEFHLQGLVETLKLGGRIDDVIETMVRLYVAGDVATIWPLIQTVLPEADGDAGGYAEFERTLVTARNHVMASEATPFLDRGSVFVAVGALHLPGPEGVVALLRKAGYTVTAVR
jgi:uncharacterized protein YbaP (TraB family)